MPRNDRRGEVCAIFTSHVGIGKIDAECSNRTRRGDPKLYIGTARGEVWTEKKEYLFLKSPKAFLPYKKYIVKKQDIPIKQI